MGLFSDQGELEAIEGFSTDITARKQAEAALRRMYAELEERVKERTATLHATNSRLHQEIEERRRTLDALRDSEARYRALIDSSPDSVAVLDLAGKIIFASLQAAAQHGVDRPEDLVGTEALDWIAAEDRARFQANVRRLLDEGILRDTQYQVVRQGGKTFAAEISSAVIRDAAGNPAALIGVYRDITERKRSEEKLRRKQRALRRMVMAGDHERRLLTYELHDGAAQQLMAAMLQLQAVQRSAPGQPEAAATGYREVMDTLRQASAELRMVMSRLRTPVLDKFGLPEAIEDIAAQLREQRGAPDIDYQHAVQFRRLEATLENSLFRIAQEALTNACRHSRSDKVRVRLMQAENFVTLEVRDWGTGFDRKTMARNRFGLEGIRERARLLGGKLRIISQLGEGTIVRVTFPVVEMEASQ